MRRLAHFAWAAAVGLAATSGASAQTTVPTTTTPTTIPAHSTGGQGGSSGPTTFGQSQLQQMEAAPTIAGTSIGQGGGGGSNAFSAFYANPLYAGRAGSTGNDAPGGFGVPMYGTGGSTGIGGRATGGQTGAGRSSLGGRTGATGQSFGGTTPTGRTGGGQTGGGQTGGGRAGQTGFGGGQTGFGGGQTGFGGLTGFGGGQTGLGGRAGQLGGQTGLGGLTGFGGTRGGQSSGGGEVIPMQRPIIHAAVVRFPAPVVTNTQMNTDLRGMLDRSSMLTNPRGIGVRMDGNVVVLTGAVRDAEEAQTAEGMVRLTPGVYEVKNELKYPTR